MTFLTRIGNAMEAAQRWDSTLIKVSGISFMSVGIVMLVPIITGLIYGEDISPFLIPLICCLCISMPMLTLFRFSKNMRTVDGHLAIMVVWGVITTASSVPFILSGMSIVDGWFESVSGFTTTGATVITDLESCSRSLLIWRSFTQWTGGIAIILIFLALFPMLGLGGRSLFSNEMSGSGSKNLTTKMTDMAIQFAIIYAILSSIFLVAAVVMGVDPFEAICLTFSTISTGGFMINSKTAVGFDWFVQVLIMVFMFLGATNFYLHYQRIYRKKGAGYLKNPEFRWMVFIFAIASIFVLLTTLSDDRGILPQIKDSIFAVVSIGSSTGYMVLDSSVWADVTAGGVGILFLLALIGGSSGSTSGGIKVGRIVTVMKYLTVDVKKRLYPRGVFETKVGGEVVDETTLSAAQTLFILFTLTIVAGMVGILVLEPQISLDSAIATSLTTVTNCGFVGPFSQTADLTQSFAVFSDASKLFLSALMWVGRLEIGTAVILITPYFWKEIFKGRRKIKRDKKAT